MTHMLMHKKTPVVDLLIDSYDGAIKKIGQIHNLENLPIGSTYVFGPESGMPERRKLNEWWVERSIPDTRENIQAALKQMNLAEITGLLVKCHGLSLSDQYWIKQLNSETELKWENINFFSNVYSEDVGNILFGYEPQDDEINFMSPDNTCDGWLSKKWVISDGKRLLMKGGSRPYFQEPVNELIACAVMKRLGIPHVPYTLTFNNQLPYSLCETLVTQETDLIPAWRVSRTLKKDNRDSEYMHLLRCAETLAIPNAESSLEKMLVLDYIIANTDRHYNNFGFVRNSETLEWLGMAPVYDSGTSLWHDSQYTSQLPKSKPFRATHAEQIKLVTDFTWFDNKSLSGLNDECAEIFAMSDFITESRRELLVKVIERRVKDITEMAQK